VHGPGQTHADTDDLVAAGAGLVEPGSNRNAIYKNLFDARRSLRARMAAAGHPVPHEDAA
jgi:hypothetical protein